VFDVYQLRWRPCRLADQTLSGLGGVRPPVPLLMRLIGDGMESQCLQDARTEVQFCLWTTRQQIEVPVCTAGSAVSEMQERRLAEHVCLSIWPLWRGVGHLERGAFVGCGEGEMGIPQWLRKENERTTPSEHIVKPEGRCGCRDGWFKRASACLFASSMPTNSFAIVMFCTKGWQPGKSEKGDSTRTNPSS
jgi:hypothetical protein